MRHLRICLRRSCRADLGSVCKGVIQEMSGRVMRPCHFAICGDWRNDAMNSLGGPVVGIVTGDCYRVEDVLLD